MLELLNVLNSHGLSVDLDATFGKREFHAKLSNWSKQKNIDLKFVQCTAPESVLIQGLCNRKHDISDAMEDLLPIQQRSFEPVTTAEQLSLISLETPTDWKKILRTALP
jgi:predicted kinase